MIRTLFSSVPLTPFVRFQFLGRLVTVLVAVWAITASIWAYRSIPRVILIGLDETGTRVITTVDDPIIARERVNFVREFLRGYYVYDSASYPEHISQVGSFMSDKLWKEKESGFQGIAKQMKERPLSQDAHLLDLRKVSESEFEADLAISIRSRLQERAVRYRVAVQIAPRKRNTENPYPLEVTSVHETEIR